MPRLVAERDLLSRELRAAIDELATASAATHALRQESAQLRAELAAVRAEDAAEIARLWTRINSHAAMDTTA